MTSVAVALSIVALVAGWMSAELRRVDAERRAAEAERVRAAQLATVIRLIGEMQAQLPGHAHPAIAVYAEEVMNNDWGNRGRTRH